MKKYSYQKQICLNNSLTIKCTKLKVTLLQFSQASLATLSAALAFPIQNEVPVQKLHIFKLNTETLHGPLFEGLNVTQLIIEDSPIKIISSDALYYTRDTLKVRYHYIRFPRDAYTTVSKIAILVK